MCKIKWDQRALERGLSQIFLKILRKKTYFWHIIQGFPGEGIFWMKTLPPLKHKAPSRKWFLERNQKNLKLSNTCVSLIKQHWKMMIEIPQKHDFLTWSIRNFVRKVKQFVAKYYFTWLIDLAEKLYDTEKFLDFILKNLFIIKMCH